MSLFNSKQIYFSTNAYKAPYVQSAKLIKKMNNLKTQRLINLVALLSEKGFFSSNFITDSFFFIRANVKRIFGQSHLLT